MNIAYEYSHLNGLEYMMIHRPRELAEIRNAIAAINASLYTKISRDKTKAGKTLLKQSDINKQFELQLVACGWRKKVRKNYFVADNIDTIKDTIHENNAKTQEQEIIKRGSKPLKTYNEVDFVKNEIAVEVQFGKYFSVAYDLHVKHTFFYLRNEINVGVEIIPTKVMKDQMDTGVAWFENEVANVIREGRSNPTVPIVIFGIEP